MARLSGLQREVLSLYRKCLRETRKKPLESRSNFRNYARAEFQKHRSVNKKDFGAIEYLLRKGHRQLEMFLVHRMRCSLTSGPPDMGFPHGETAGV